MKRHPPSSTLFPHTALFRSHVHVNEPGRTEWEGFATATRAAIAGGIATIVDMPLNSLPPTTTLAALELKRGAAAASAAGANVEDRKSTRLNSHHANPASAVF